MRPEVIYIASVGYSGSTLLDMLLGSNGGVVSVGEVYLLSRYAREGALCTCGEPVPDCPFWVLVQDALRERLQQPELRLAEFPLTVEAPVQSLHRRLPSLNDLALAAGSRMVWQLAASTEELAGQYRDASVRAHLMFEVIADVLGARVLVDSSKYAIPMKALYLGSPRHVKIVHLVRDGRATAYSLMDHHDMSFVDAARTWRRYNWNLELMLASIPGSRKFRLRYEDLCDDPEGRLSTIGAHFKLPVALQVHRLRKESFHNIGGNPMRFRHAEVEIVRDDRWKARMTPADADTFERIAGSANRRYGYV